jgi:hypothetical protein
MKGTSGVDKMLRKFFFEIINLRWRPETTLKKRGVTEKPNE